MKKSSLKDADFLLEKHKTVIIGGGPSLDYMDHEIKFWIQNDYTFILTDIIADRFIRRWNPDRRIIFTVESRRTFFLSKLNHDEMVGVYAHANMKNLPKNLEEVYLFLFDFDIPDEKYQNFILSSPGTVTGAALFWVLSRYTFFLKKTPSGRLAPELHLAGFDLSYPENQMYNRYSWYRSFNQTRYNLPVESVEWMMTIKKSDYAWIKYGNQIKTSREFRRTKENSEHLINSMSSKIQLFDYSPLGITHPLVQKKVPLLLLSFFKGKPV